MTMREPVLHERNMKVGPFLNERWASMNETYTTQAWMTFDRSRLRKIIVMQSNEGTLCMWVKILDRETLEHSEARSYWTPATFGIVSALLMAEGIIKKVGANIK